MIRRRLAVAAVAAGVLTVTLPGVAAAHGLVGRQDLPIPRWLFGWGAALVLIVSFVALATLWPRPRWQEPRERPLARVPAWLEIPAGALGVALFALVVYAGLAGTQSATANLAPTFVYVAFWIGLVPLSLLFGDVFAAFNPWRAIGRATGWVVARLGRGAPPEPLAYPERLGRWPAAVGILAFAWVELVWADGDDPSSLAVSALVYAAVQLVGMSLYGVRAWERNGDAFGVYFALVAALAPLRWERGVVHRRPMLSGAPGVLVPAGSTALLCVLIGSTSFDGLTGGALWGDVVGGLQGRFLDLGLAQGRALEAAFTVGLLASVAFVAVVYRLGVLGMRAMGEQATHSVAGLSRAFAHSLIPIAVAYVVAHYFSLLVYQAQALAFLASDPLGEGADVFGTAGRQIDYGVISATGIWYVQVGALVLGHAAALALAHDRALALYADARIATRSQGVMLVVMVAFTSLGLWLLSAANG